MTAVLVHGVPETTAVWDPLVAALERDDVALLALPGFGSPLPDDFEPTMYRYADWLAEELARFDEVDLVGHDWGALLSMRVLADAPANVRTWAIDTGDLSDDFRWHATARIWQTPVEGEAFVDSWLAATPTERGELLQAVGAPQPGAQMMGESIDPTMCRAILGLYRSAVDIGTEWGPGVDSWRGRGLVVGSMKDNFRNPVMVSRLAERTGAEILELPECGHWWMLEEPVVVARALEAFWARED
jgi:pimeloyl-ACP methyl ester carboxylesterase